MKERVSGRQGRYMLALFILGSTLVTDDVHATRQDAWLAFLMALAAAVPVLLVYRRIQRIFRGASLYDVAFASFGKGAGAVIAFVYVLFFAHTAAMIVSRFIVFCHMITLVHTPGILLAFILCALCGWMAALGAGRFGRASILLFLVVAVEMMVLLTLTGGRANLSNLLPMFEAEPSAYASEAFSFFSVPFTQLVVFLCVFHEIPDRSEQSKAWWVGTAVGALIVAVNLIRAAVILGGEIMGTLYYSTFLSSSVIGMDSLLQRVEVILSHAFFLSMFVKVGVYLYASFQGCARLFPKWNARIVAGVLGGAVVAGATFMSGSATLTSDLFSAYRSYSVLFHVLIPLIIWIRGELIVRKQKKRAPVA